LTSLEIVLSLVVAIAIFIIIIQRKRISKVISERDQFSIQKDEVISAKQSQSTLYGKITEHFAPFMEKYPYDRKRFRFIGSPIDGIQFEDDKVVFIEIKSAKSALQSNQRKIRKLIQERKVEWFEFDIRSETPSQ